MTTFIVPIEPVGKGRHRTIRNGPRAGHTYTPTKTTNAEQEVAQWYALTHEPPFAADVPLRMVIAANFAMPKSWSEKKRVATDGEPCTKKPDYDNICKLIGDALNGVAYHDDAQITDSFCTKRWARKGSIVVTIERSC